MQTVSPTSITGSIRIKSIQRAMKQRRAEEHEAHLNELYNTDTVLMKVTAPMQRLERVTRPMLLLDVCGRPYVSTSGVHGETLDLIKEAVSRYYSVQQVYPSEILLSPMRYLMLVGKATHYQINGTFIPLKFEDATYTEGRFDVLVRGAL